jgi:hypothetical protein
VGIYVSPTRARAEGEVMTCSKVALALSVLGTVGVGVILSSQALTRFTQDVRFECWVCPSRLLNDPGDAPATGFRPLGYVVRAC